MPSADRFINKLRQLADVNVTPADGDVLQFNSSTGKWESVAAGMGGSGGSGYSGYSGNSGASGTSGHSGQSGFSGSSGTSGQSGISGSGLSGYSGLSGVSGAGSIAPSSATFVRGSGGEITVVNYSGGRNITINRNGSNQITSIIDSARGTFTITRDINDTITGVVFSI